MSNTSETPVVKKPWYTSKTVLFAAVVVLIFGGNIAFGWISGQGVTPEQINAVSDAQPAVKEIIERVQNGESILNMLGIIVGIVIGLLRAWTNTGLAMRA
jgi:Zn-dependent protease